MNGSYSYEESLGKEEHLCPVCVRKLQYALQFDFRERYVALGDEKSKMLALKIQNALIVNTGDKELINNYQPLFIFCKR